MLCTLLEKKYEEAREEHVKKMMECKRTRGDEHKIVWEKIPNSCKMEGNMQNFQEEIFRKKLGNRKAMKLLYSKGNG
jgi:hypothetical protein